MACNRRQVRSHVDAIRSVALVEVHAGARGRVGAGKDPRVQHAHAIDAMRERGHVPPALEGPLHGSPRGLDALDREHRVPAALLAVDEVGHHRARTAHRSAGASIRCAHVPTLFEAAFLRGAGRGRRLEVVVSGQLVPAVTAGWSANLLVRRLGRPIARQDRENGLIGVASAGAIAHDQLHLQVAQQPKPDLLADQPLTGQ